jgi:hypothetical protein
MPTSAVFARAPARAGMYESFYLRAVSPDRPLAVWVRYTVSKPAHARALGSVWCTVFDAERGRPFMHKCDSPLLSVPRGGWIAVADSAIGPARAEGGCGDARWSLRHSSEQAELRHLSPRWLYRAPLPRTKLTSPEPSAVFDGTLELAGREPLTLSRWPGMVGHNWGAEHAERWIWLHGIAFTGAPDAWLDLALGRVRIGGRLTPWVGNGALYVRGRRRRLGGFAARATEVAETPHGCSLSICGAGGLRLRAEVAIPGETAAGWRYADPDGTRTHDVVNCSIAALTLTVDPGDGSAPIELNTPHGAAYELGMHERDHGVPIAPFGDG